LTGQVTNPPQSDLSLELAGDTYYDKVYGCWLGKNAGGTLGTPLEKTFGEDEPFDVWWYPELQEGGLPNDDLEMQLAWLKAIEEVGPGLTSRDMARYWLDHVGYNFDEYGLSKANLRLGLEPPVSGLHNNWFVDCMGCPIRSEIWACVAPGAPRVAARYAILDGVCDHAGGESVYGELFNVAVESAAFLLSDPQLLIDIGLSYVPEGSKTAAAVKAAVAAHADGLDWKAARERVRVATPHYNAQYSPLNLGFQVIGLLYGKDFGEGICMTVNCGYDTDSSGAAIGSYLGILAGKSGLPGKWIDPLGDGIATNESWGGVRHLSDGPNPIPANLDELTRRIRRVAYRVLTEHGVLDGDGVLRTTVDDLYCDDTTEALRDADPSTVRFEAKDFDTLVNYHGSPVAVPGGPREISATLVSNRADDVAARLNFYGPEGWEIGGGQDVTVPGYGSVTATFGLTPGPPSSVEPSNLLWLEPVLTARPAPASIPIVTVGATAVRLAGPFARGEDDDDSLLAKPFPPEQVTDNMQAEDTRPGEWQTRWAPGHDLDLSSVLTAAGVYYVQLFLRSPDERNVHLVVDSNLPSKVWLNGSDVRTRSGYNHLRPNYSGPPGAGGMVELVEGWNEVLVKLVRDDRDLVGECHLLLSDGPRFFNGAYDIGRSSFPWS
jgi:ADP-ribosylglycohydrolase